ncbi:MAG TPA: FG-GAP-like repeat-containing protein, partial [Myxococcota bacterium]|nr:FG-GAP-like repeat-containing protein [Myxococcota bacterium]
MTLLLLLSCTSSSPPLWTASFPALQMQARMEEESLVFEDSTGALTLRTVGVGRQSLVPFAELPVLQKERGTHTSRGEWLYPLGSGLGQGWTLTERPAGRDPLQIVVEAPEAELALWESSQGVDVRAADGSRWTYSGIQAEDADGRLLPAWMEVDGSRIHLRVDDAGARWPIQVDPVVTTAANSIAGSSSAFLGQAVAGGDVNGDGYDDFLVSAYRISTRGAVYVYLGSASGIGNTPATTLYPATSGYDGFFGWEIRTADFNSDGYADTAVSEPEYSNGNVYIFMGSSAGLNATASYVIGGSTSRERNGYALAVGDYDGDGYDDLVSTSIYRNYYGSADVYYGSVNGLSSLRMATMDQASSFHDMGYCADAGDINGDGYDDLVVGHYEGARYYGEMFVYMGSSTGLASSPAASYVGPQESIGFGLSVAVFGDVNGDGYEDVGMGVSSLDLPYGDSGAVYMYYGSASGLPANPNTTLYGTGYGDRFGRSLEAAGDTNADGYADAVIGSPAATGGTYASGVAKIFPGSASGLVEADADRVYAGTTPYENYASEVGGVGDLNGDGFDDVAVG